MQATDGAPRKSRSTVEPESPLTAVHYVALFFAVAIPNTALMFLLSGVGWGFQVYEMIALRYVLNSGFGCFAAIFVLGLLYWIFDFAHWTGTHQALSAFPLWILLTVGLMLLGREWPSMPILMMLGQKSIFIAIVRIKLARGVVRTGFFTLTAVYTIIAAATMLGVFLWWYFSDTGIEWLSDLPAIDKKMPNVLETVYSERPLIYTADCGPHANLTNETLDAREQISFACTQARTVFFMIWFCPVIGCCINIAVAVFLYTHTKALHIEDPEQFEVQIKEYLLIIGALLVALFVAGKVSGSIHASGAIMTFFSLLLVVVLGWMYMELGPGADGHEELSDRMREALEKDVVSYVEGVEHGGGRTGMLLQLLLSLPQNEWAQAMFLGAIGALIPVYFVLDVLRRRIRKCTGWGKAAEDTEDTLTRGAVFLKDTIATWHIPIVLTKVLLIGEVVFLFQIGVSKAINVFLSWLNAWLLENEVAFPMCILIVFTVGFLMFLLPPVPGVPVYVFAGVVLASQGERVPGIGFFGGAAWAVSLSFVLKLVASLGQYGLGYVAGQNVKVQQLIGVDTVPTRAVESILKQDGLSLAKVAVLVGAPDWPTSVTCGILSMNAAQMLLGTAPVVVINTPCALAGAYLSKSNAGATEQLLSSFFLAFSAVMLAGGGLFAFISIVDVIDKDGEELEKPREEHRAVAELTEQEKHATEAFREATRWENFGPAGKLLLILTASAMMTSTFAFMVFGSKCFREFSVSSRIDAPYVDGGLNGDWLSIILPPGRVALGVFFFAVLLHVIVSQLMSGMAKAEMSNAAKVREVGLVEMSTPGGG